MRAEKQSVGLPSMSGMNVLSNGRSAGRFVGRAIGRATDVRNECVNGQATKLEVRQAIHRASSGADHQIGPHASYPRAERTSEPKNELAGKLWQNDRHPEMTDRSRHVRR